jgi:Lon protease-like protein
MEPFEDAWPPQTFEVAPATPVPMFPLPGAFLFPGQLMPLHIFEPRYRQMIEDSLDRSGRLVIATVRDADRDRLAAAPPVVPIAGLGEIARHQKLPDGRFLLWLCGLGRVRIEEVESERLYRQVRVQALLDVEPTEDEDRDLRPEVCEAIQRRTGTDLAEHAGAKLGALADVLAQCLVLPEPVLLELHAETDVAERARKALAAEQRFPKSGA